MVSFRFRPVGCSTGAIALGDFETAVAILSHHTLEAIELSALRVTELEPLIRRAPELDLRSYSYVSVHAPGRFSADQEPRVIEALLSVRAYGWHIVLHPDAVHDFTSWRIFGESLLIENMDKRKSLGRTVDELSEIFLRVPDAGMCFDLAHARQVDPSMTEAARLLRVFGSRIVQLHVSEVNTRSKHDRLSWYAVQAFQKVAALVPQGIPIILESPLTAESIDDEVDRARSALTSPQDALVSA